MTSRTPLYFWHIPKTAGTSLITWLDGQFATAEVFQPQLLPQLREFPDDRLADYLFYRGHLGAELTARFGGRLTTVTLLREPRARTVSHMAHIWREEGHYLHATLRRCGPSLIGALSDPLLRRALSNVQSRYLALNPAATAAQDPHLQVPQHLRGQARFELAPLPQDALLSARAIWRLLRLDHVGVAANLEDFCRRVSLAQGWPVPNVLPLANVRPPGSAPWAVGQLTAAELRLLDEVNGADRQVYRVGALLAARRRQSRTRPRS